MTYPVDWWYERKNELISLVHANSPVYVYNEEVINDTLFDPLSIDAIDSLFYPIHINHHPQILEQVNRLGAGFGCVSSLELSYLLERFSLMKPEEFLFTPNYICPHDYEYGLKLGVNVVVDTFHPLKTWTDLFRNREIFIGIDTDNKGTSSKLSTNHQYPSVPKISYSHIEPLMEILDRIGVSVKGIHIQRNSCIHDSLELTETASSLVEIYRHFPDVSFLSLGNGMGISTNSGQDKLDIPVLTRDLEQFREFYPWSKLWFDPGSHIISYAGVLLISVDQVYKNNGIYCVKIDADIKSLIQQGLFNGRHHNILNLSKVNEEATMLASIIWQDCEPWNGLCYMKKLAPVKERDILLITDAGAYGPETDLNTDFRESISEHYLKARRICQVSI